MDFFNKKQLSTFGARQHAESQPTHSFDFQNVMYNANACEQKLLEALNYPCRKMGAEVLVITPSWSISDLGAFTYNLKTGHWFDSFTDSIGIGLISLLMYLEDKNHREAAILMMHHLLGDVAHEIEVISHLTEASSPRYSRPRLD